MADLCETIPTSIIEENNIFRRLPSVLMLTLQEKILQRYLNTKYTDYIYMKC